MFGRIFVAVVFLWILSLFLFFEALNAWLIVKFLAILGITLGSAMNFCFISLLVLTVPLVLVIIIALIQEA